MNPLFAKLGRFRRRTTSYAAATFACVFLCTAAPARPQGWPEKPVSLVAPAPPGGGVDAVARLVADVLAAGLKQPVLVENRTGAATVVGAGYVARAAADGYTLLLTSSTHVALPSMVKSLPFDVVKDFAGVALLGEAPLVFVSSEKSRVKSIAALRAMVARNESLSFASPSAETQLATALIAEALNVRPLIVPYKGAGPAMTDVLGGHVPFMVSSIASVQPFKDTGRLNLLGIASNKRFSGWPDVPTLAEQGLQVEAKAWYVLLAPAGTPPPILQRVNALIENASRTPAYQARLKALSIEPMHATAVESDAFLRSEAIRWRDLMKAAGIEPE